MNIVDRVIGKLTSFDQVETAVIPSDDVMKQICDEEMQVKSSSGMPLINRAIQETMKRNHHIILVKTSEFEPVPHHRIIMETPDGKLAGFDVPKGMEYVLEGRTDLTEVSDDFYLTADAADYEVIYFVLCAIPLTVLGEQEGVKNAIMFSPSPTTDSLIRKEFGFKMDRRYCTSIISFDYLDE